MKISSGILLTLGLTISLFSQSFAKTFLIPVEEVFESIIHIEEITVTGYIGDSIMTYIDIESQDTLKLDCKWKKYNDSSIKLLNENDPNYNSWEGTFPEEGETITMLTYEYGGNRVLFARKENGHLRFWNPVSIPFANTVFLIAKKGIYVPTELCLEDYQTKTEFYCSDGFLIDERKFERIRANR